MRREATISILCMVIIQLALLISMTPTNSHLLHEQDGSFDKTRIEENQNLLRESLSFLIGLLSIKQIGTVSAGAIGSYQNPLYQGEYKANYNAYFSDEADLVCCLEMDNGAACQNVPMDYANCSAGTLPTSCEEVSQCEVGCCNDLEEGLCSTNAPRDNCEVYGGEWSEKADCNIQECQKGCCLVSGEPNFVTERGCEVISMRAGFETFNFEQDISVTECLIKAKEQKVGACLTDFGCVFGTEAECAERLGDFYNNYLCSNEELNTSCKKQISTSCIDSLHEVYWMDSCGNRENIYSSDKDYSFNDGMVLSKEDSCNANSNNEYNEDCGNCNYELGSSCSSNTTLSTEDGKEICKSMNCVDKNGQARINGESWCVYDAAIGNRSDVVGSRHWKRMCIDGEVKLEACADFRNDVCAQDSEINEAGVNVSLATCRINRWKSCIAISNTASSELENQTQEELCNEDSDCEWVNTPFGEISIPYCLPRYPPGLKFWERRADQVNQWGKKDTGDETKAEKACDVASHTCTAIYAKTVTECNWHCVANCECEEASYTENMNDFCTSLGDCGGYVNIENDWTDGGYSICEAPRLGPEYIQRITNKTLNFMGNFAEIGSATEYAYSIWERNKHTEGDDDVDFSANTALGVVSIVGAVWGTLLAVVGTIFISYFALLFLIIVVLFILFLILALVCKGTREVDVVFTCKPWTAPVNDQKCENCNDNPLKPCTEYRCKSLGAACVLENAQEENPVCFEENPNDGEFPIISLGNITENYKFSPSDFGAEVTTIDGDAIPEFSPVLFSIMTNEFATCRMSYNKTLSYEEMDSDFGGSSLFSREHTSVYMMPNLDASGMYDLNGTVREKFATLDMYVRCQDNHGNFNLKEFILRFHVKNGPDLTAPLIMATTPPTESYIKYGETEREIGIFTIEPAECRWSKDDNKTYEDMENEMKCGTNLSDATEFGWMCNATLTELDKKENTIYIKCEDQPWLDLPDYQFMVEKENRSRNANVENFVYTLLKSESALNITKITPTGTIETGLEPTTIDFSATTSGGADGRGNAVCKYSFDEQNWAGEFRDTGDSNHKQKGFRIPSGDYEIKVFCKDEAGNEANGKTDFTVHLDEAPPMTVRTYRNGGELKVVTDEDAECFYSFDTCFFKFENGTAMTSGFDTFHSATWEGGETYHIKCRDIWGNFANKCNIKITPDFFK